MSGVCDYLTTGNTAGLPAQGLTGFEELEGHNDLGQGVSSVGYTLQDINNDKVPELIFGLIDYPEARAIMAGISMLSIPLWMVRLNLLTRDGRAAGCVCFLKIC